MNKRAAILLSAAVCLLASCLQNDIPYPTVVPKFETIMVEEAVSVNIDSKVNQINVEMDEEADLAGVTISYVSFSNSPVSMSPDLVNTFDLREPLHFTLTSYQEYRWKMVATQPIEYNFTLAGQVGESTIDDVNHRVLARVAKGKSLSYLQVTGYKLGPRNISSYSVDLEDVHDFSEPVEVDVTAHGRVSRWTIFVEKSDISVDFEYLDAWSRVAWVGARGIQGEECGIRYRKTSDSEWIEVPATEIVVEGGNFACAIDNLEPDTSYLCQAYCGEFKTEERHFTTQEVMDVPNGNMEVYSYIESDKYYSFFDETMPKWWDNGNIGATMVGGSSTVCTPDTQDKAEGKASARLNSRYIVIKFAAGNLFCGEFAGLVGVSGGKVNFGRPFTLRPRRLLLMLKYEPGKVDYVNGYPDGQKVSVGDPDRCQVFCALGDWDYRKYGGTPDSPVQVNTTDKSTFFDPEGQNVIAYGSYVTDKSTNGWILVEIPLKYVSTSRVPSHIIISCAASMLGDYFTGSSTSVLWVDGMRFEY